MQIRTNHQFTLLISQSNIVWFQGKEELRLRICTNSDQKWPQSILKTSWTVFVNQTTAED